MSTSLTHSLSVTHPTPISAGEQLRLEDDIKRCLLQVPTAGNDKIKDRKKDIAKRFNKVAETLSQFLVHSYNNGKPITHQLVTSIGDFFSARTQSGIRRLSELFQLETKEEGELNLVQMEIAQGDRSTSTLIRLITEIDELVPVLLEIRAAAVIDVQKPGRAQ